jgi:hypothetical protein
MRNMNSILSLGETRHSYRSSQMRHDLLNLFELFHHAKSTLKRDRLFTLLSVAADGDSSSFTPDYSSTFEVIVRRYASVFVERKKTFELLYRAGISSQPDRFPSWIPDWTSSPYPKTITSWRTERAFCASGTKAECACVSPTSDSVLLIDGCVVDKIVKLGKCTSEIEDALDYIADVLKMIESLKSYPTGENIDELKWKIAIGDAKEPPWGDWAGNNFRAAFHALTEYLELREGQSEERFTTKYSPAEITERLSHLHEQLWLFLFTAIDFSERFQPAVVCVTEGGYVGLVPGSACKGDTIAVLYGGAVPFCLRRSDEGSMYHLLGECFIHGIMHGEALAFEGVQEGEIILH